MRTLTDLLIGWEPTCATNPRHRALADNIGLDGILLEKKTGMDWALARAQLEAMAQPDYKDRHVHMVPLLHRLWSRAELPYVVGRILGQIIEACPTVRSDLEAWALAHDIVVEHASPDGTFTPTDA